jgi:hypothetical protein
MRAFAILPLLLACACSDEAAAPQAKPAAVALAPGQWEVTTEVVRVKSLDQGPPAIRAKAGDKKIVRHCLAEEDGTKPPADLLAGAEKGWCKSDNLYFSKEAISADATCRPPGLGGELRLNLSGSFEAEKFEVDLDGATFLPGNGDIQVREKVTGRHTGPCPK